MDSVLSLKIKFLHIGKWSEPANFNMNFQTCIPLINTYLKN